MLLPLAALLALSLPALSQEGDVAYHLTMHADPAAGVDRLATHPVGACVQCHSSRSLPASPFEKGLFAANDNGLCYACHAGPGSGGPYLGSSTFDASSHRTSGALLWPGPVPPARPAGDEGLCLDCHTPHGLRDATGLVPTLGIAREESLCLGCHGAAGPAGTDVAGQLALADAHPVVSVLDVHDPTEGLDPAAHGVAARHAECTDCHNPHAATPGALLGGVARIGVINGAALAAPAYVPRGPGDPAPVLEYEVCFKCHSSWTTRPAGASDLALELNPANVSYHPIEAAGTNATAKMATNLAGGTGTPDLGTGSLITCSDCHGSDALPTTITTTSSYTGAVPTGPHGSGAGTAAGFSPSILRGSYRVELKAVFAPYAAADFELCNVCHTLAFASDGSGDARGDTNFRFHGFHLSNIGDDPAGGGAGGIGTPGAGRGNAICKECHYSLHGVAGAYYASNASNSRLVSFSPNVTGPGGAGTPSYTRTTWGGSCNLRCHGMNHSPETY